MLILEAVELNSTGTLTRVRLAEIEEKHFNGNEMIPKHRATLRTFDANVALNALRSGNKVEGLKIENGMLVAGNGAFTRYRKITHSDANPIVIVARVSINNENKGFCILGEDGAVGNWSEEKTVLAAKKFGIANGKLVTDENGEHISSIVGEYRIKSITKQANNTVNTPITQPAPTVVNKPIATPQTTPIAKAPTIPSSSITPNVINNTNNENRELEKPRTNDVEEARKLVDTMDYRYSRRIDIGGQLDREGDVAKGPDGLSPQDKIAIATLNIKRMNTFIYTIFVSMNRCPVKNSEVRMAAVSPFSMTLYYDTEFINSLTCGQVLFVCIHETYHILMKHGMRQGKRIQLVWNKAGDYYINKLIAEQFGIAATWPRQSEIRTCEFISNPTWKPSTNDNFRYIEGIENILWDEEVNTGSDSAEHIYSRIMQDELDQLKKQIEQMQKGESEEGDGDNNDQSNGNNGSNDNQRSDDSEQNGGSGNTQNNEDDSQSRSKRSGSKDASGSESGEDSEEENGSSAGDSSDNEESSDTQDGMSGASSDGEEDSDENSDGASSSGMSGTDENSDGASSSGMSSTDENNKNDNHSKNGNSDDSNSSQGNDKDSEDGDDSGDSLEDQCRGLMDKARKEIIDKIRQQYEDIVNDTKKDKVDEKEQKEAEEKVKMAVSNAITASRMAGHELDKEAKRFVQDILEPKVDFRAILRNKFNLISEHAMTWKRPGRRGEIAIGIESPGRVKKDEQGLRAVIAIDSSGSVTDEDLMRAFGYIKALCNQMKVELEVIFWDTNVSARYEINDLKDLYKIKEFGSGGTNVTCVFEYLKGLTLVDGHKNTQPVDVLIVFTDGYFDKNYGVYRRVAKDTIWILQDRQTYYDFEPLFGIKAPIAINRD